MKRRLIGMIVPLRSILAVVVIHLWELASVSVRLIEMLVWSILIFFVILQHTFFLSVRGFIIRWRWLFLVRLVIPLMLDSRFPLSSSHLRHQLFSLLNRVKSCQTLLGSLPNLSRIYIKSEDAWMIMWVRVVWLFRLLILAEGHQSLLLLLRN